MINNLWKYFKYNELFEIKNWKRVIIDEIKSDNWKYNFVSAIDYNNWVFCKTDIIPNHKAKTIAVNYDWNWVAEAYYQDEDYWALDSVNVLYPKFEINIYIWLFFATLIRKEKYRFSYGRKWNSERMRNSEIKLPVDNLWNPDFKFMENFVKNLDKDNLIFKNYKENIKKEKLNLNNKKFEYFEVKDLFEVKGTKTTKKEFLEESWNWEFPYITTQSTNNWVAWFYSIFTEKWFVLTIDSAVTGFCSYQEKDFSASDHVEKLTPKFEINKYIWIFLTTIINKEQYRYNYWRKFNQERIKNTKIKLPVDDSWNPDFKFMEDFIKSLNYSKYL